MSDENTIEMIPVVSSQIAAVGYSTATRQLRIEFSKNGAVYEYDNVDQSVFDQLVNAPSVGSYFASAVKGIYPYRRIG